MKPKMMRCRQKGVVWWICFLPGFTWALGHGATLAEAYSDWLSCKHLDQP